MRLNKLTNIVINTLLLFFSTVTIHAAHIVGGEMYYECLGYANGGLDSTKRVYLITVNLYRDCLAQNAAWFDTPMGLTVWKKNANGNNYLQFKNPVNTQNDEFSFNLDGPYNIDPPDYPCLILPPNLCVHQGRYQGEIELPVSNEEYVIVWQRCCRNNTITNILNPESTGATFTISIHPLAQKECNSSPQFKEFPPTVVCANNPLKFDHSAIDKEGDLLIYDFCEPLAGGGRNGTGCNAVSPSPDCRPPYSPVIFRAPFYTYNYPLGGNPKVSINSISGLITGEPNDIGQFVVGVCVREYRNGVLLSTTRRDFQFNVASCEGTVVASLTGAANPFKKKYEVLLCGTDEYQFNNNSYQQKYIHDVLWTYENGGTMDTFLGWAPKIKFKEGGVHEGKFILNVGSNCSDTAEFKVTVIPDLKADFKANYDSCIAGPVTFLDLSSSSYSTIINHNWNFGDGFQGYKTKEVVNYRKPGIYNVQQEIIDNFGCRHVISKPVSWFPSPNVIIFEPNKKEGCVPLTVNFKNISYPTDSTYKFKWTFSDSSLSQQGYNISHQFDSIGSYHLKLEVTSPIGCYNQATFTNVVRAFPYPIAALSQDKKIIKDLDKIVHLNDESKGTLGRTWIIDGKDFYFDKNLALQFEDTGLHKIIMICTDKYLCTDTIETEVLYLKSFSLFMPNAFTPNNDGKNDLFRPVGEFESLENFTLTIFDRWGGKIYQTNNVEEGWNGKFQNSNKDVPPGSFVYELSYKAVRQDKKTERHLFTLVR